MPERNYICQMTIRERKHCEEILKETSVTFLISQFPSAKKYFYAYLLMYLLNNLFFRFLVLSFLIDIF